MPMGRPRGIEAPRVGPAPPPPLSIAFAASRARVRRNPGNFSTCKRVSSSCQRTGIASSDSTRTTPSMPVGAIASASSGHTVDSPGRDRGGVVVGDEDELVVAERLRGRLIPAHGRVVLGEERLDRLLIRHALAHREQGRQREQDGGGRRVTGADQQSNHVGGVPRAGVGNRDVVGANGAGVEGAIHDRTAGTMRVVTRSLPL